MPGERPRNFRAGDRAEYLGAFLLSRIAQAIPVPRQEDYGVDYLGALLRPEGQSMLIGRRFAVQWKSNLDDIREPFGSFRNGKWRQRECLWLLGRDPFPVDTTPFFLGHIDLAAGRARLYSTALMWHARWHGYPTEVVFVPDQWPAYDVTFPPGPLIELVPLATVYPDGVPDGAPGLAQRAVIPLGYPVVEIDLAMVAELDPSPRLAAITATLDAWCRVDELNRLAASLEVPVCFYHWAWMTNEPPDPRDLRPESYANPDARRGLPAAEIEGALWPFLDAFNHVVQLQEPEGDDLRTAMQAAVSVMRHRRMDRMVRGGLDGVDRMVALHRLRERAERRGR